MIDFLTFLYAPLAQLDRALVYGTKGWGFELLMARQGGHWIAFFRFSFCSLSRLPVSVGLRNLLKPIGCCAWAKVLAPRGYAKASRYPKMILSFRGPRWDSSSSWRARNRQIFPDDFCF